MKRDKVRNIVQEKRFNYKGYPCVILFMSMGHRCGYVGISENDRYLIGDVEEKIDCHGSITYGPCYNLHLQNDTDKVWIGFDCAHFGDGADIKKAKRYFKKDVSMFRGGTVRTLKFCKQECKHIVDQIIGITGRK